MDRIGLVCRYIREHPYCTQRELSKKLGFSLGTVNTLLKECCQFRGQLFGTVSSGRGLDDSGRVWLPLCTADF